MNPFSKNPFSFTRKSSFCLLAFALAIMVLMSSTLNLNKEKSVVMLDNDKISLKLLDDVSSYISAFHLGPTDKDAKLTPS